MRRDVIRGDFDQSLAFVGSEMERWGWWANCCWMCVSRPRRRGPTAQWWTPSRRPPPAVGWCRRSRCWWWSGRSSERRSAAASLIPSEAAGESRPEGASVKKRGWVQWPASAYIFFYMLFYTFCSFFELMQLSNACVAFCSSIHLQSFKYFCLANNYFLKEHHSALIMWWAFFYAKSRRISRQHLLIVN